MLEPKQLTSLTLGLKRENNRDLQENCSRLVRKQNKDRRLPVLTKPAIQRARAKSAYFAYFGPEKTKQQGFPTEQYQSGNIIN